MYLEACNRQFSQSNLCTQMAFVLNAHVRHLCCLWFASWSWIAIISRWSRTSQCRQSLLVSPAKFNYKILQFENILRFLSSYLSLLSFGAFTRVFIVIRGCIRIVLFVDVLDEGIDPHEQSQCRIIIVAYEDQCDCQRKGNHRLCWFHIDPFLLCIKLEADMFLESVCIRGYCHWCGLDIVCFRWERWLDLHNVRFNL